MKCDECRFQHCVANESYTEYYCELFDEDVPMHDRELSELMADVIYLLYGLEWLDSCDIGEETYKECVNKFKAKWMHRKENDRLNSYAEDLKIYYEELVEELKSYYEELVEELK